MYDAEGGITMKKNICITLAMILVLFISMVHINALDAKKEIVGYPENNDSYLIEWNDNDKVIHLPGGGYLKGEATLHKDDGTVIVYNSETDTNAITVAEARKHIFEE